MLQKVRKEYQVFAAVILMLVVSVGYFAANQKSELSKQLNDPVKASSLKETVVIDGVKEVSTVGTASSSVGPSYSNHRVIFQGNFIAPNDQITYEITYRNLSSKPKVLTQAELYPDAVDASSMTYSIGNIKENVTTVKPNQTIKVYVTAKVNETATALTSPVKTFEVRLSFD